jgi:hypothetical protein
VNWDSNLSMDFTEIYDYCISTLNLVTMYECLLDLEYIVYLPTVSMFG